MLQNTVLVTGANRGIGYEFVSQYAATGYRVIACCRTSVDLVPLQQRFPGRIEDFALDITRGESIAALKDALGETSIDILISNAGVWGGEDQAIGKMDYSAWMNAFEVNVIGPFRVIEALRSNLASGVQRKLIALSSEMGSAGLGGPGAYAYRSSKAALNRTMQAIAEDLQGDGISVLTIHPGWVRTAMGTEHASMTAEQSVTAMRKVIDKLDARLSGRFVSFDGQPLPW